MTKRKTMRPRVRWHEGCPICMGKKGRRISNKRMRRAGERLWKQDQEVE